MNTLLHSGSGRNAKLRPILLSLVAHVVFLGLLVTMPLIYYRELVVSDLLAMEALPRLGTTKTLWLQDVRAPKAAPKLRISGTRIASQGPPLTIPQGIPDPEGESAPIATVGFSGPGAMIPGPMGSPLGDLIGGSLAPEEESRKLPPRRPNALPKPNVAPLKVSSGVLGSKILEKIYPIYPPLAAKVRVEGDVMLQVKVDETGRVRDVAVLQGHPLLRDSAVQAVSQWIYSPTLLNGQPVEILGMVTVQFRLRN